MRVLTKASYSPKVTEREKRNLKVAYKAACESMVLLKNDGVLPLKTKKVAMYGPGVSMTIKGGTGSGEVNERHSVTLLEGMENRGFEVTSKKWIQDYEADFERGKKEFGHLQKEQLKKVKIKSVMEMMMATFQPPNGRAICTQDIVDSQTDTAIYVITRQAGEGADRKAEKGDCFITDVERESIQICVKNYKNFVLVINSGCSLDMSFVDEIPGIGAILFICQLGTEGGNAFADVVSGKVTPSGKLADTWAKQYSDIPFSDEYSYLNGNLEYEYYKEGIYVGSRYFDTFGVEPCYPFGYGLSYTDFSIESNDVKLDGTKVLVNAKVSNIGNQYSGKEIVQVYLSAPQGKLDKEYQSLVAFGKTKELAVQESENLELIFDMAEFGSYDEERASYILDKGEYIVRLGNSSRNTKIVALIELEEDVVISTHENICPVKEKIEELKANRYSTKCEKKTEVDVCNVETEEVMIVDTCNAEKEIVVDTCDVETEKEIVVDTCDAETEKEINVDICNAETEQEIIADKCNLKHGKGIEATVPRLTLQASAFTTVNYTYQTPKICDDKRVQKFMSKLTLKDMVEIVVGIGMFGGETRFNLPGSVGNTTSKFWKRGLANVALCDGPAGLRIQKRSTISKNGKIKAVDLPMSIFEAFPEFVKGFMKGNPQKETVIYQFTTAFPVEAALAQTWNKDLLYEVGKAVFEEMKEYGCTYWLAPAVNIHRNPLCGRNFEYFSEDPFLTGEMGTAITKGVQQKEGFYVTVKHFACNNQEDNRNKVSSTVSERALREIYLRGFENIVRKGHAKGIMTSYNKVNEVYTPNSYDLCTKVLRNEWGFDGVVMTDWFSTNKGLGNNALAMKAGNDLIMPGGEYYKKEILNGVKNGIISEADVKRCCANVVKAIMDSATQRRYIDKKVIRSKDMR